ncbi:hypothetical protein D9619_010333 [Psilocybe cf. subviscida]|uniref:Uncharacterized protein n=1 Tax=Psilocybe cf. subviscida TaxID=2480587 RepID=A0A8H5ERV8_9AGAR|nr:hypothetical protein D9619_010333 [Psilocybe cf. subviscida]
MSFSLSKNQPPEVDPWAAENMRFDRLLAIGKPIQRKTAEEYGPALDSYLDFAIKHHMLIEPNPDLLSFYVVYMNHYIGPALTDKYLTEAVDQLQPYFPDVRKTRRHQVVSRTLVGCFRRDLEAAARPQDDEDVSEEGGE